MNWACRSKGGKVCAAARLQGGGGQAVHPRQQGPGPEIVAAAEGVGSRAVHQHEAQQRVLQALREEVGRKRLHSVDALRLSGSSAASVVAPGRRKKASFCAGRRAVCSSVVSSSSSRWHGDGTAVCMLHRGSAAGHMQV